ncbi:hypothetical protein NBT05_15550 [Aquimarina sp. ERC-38]|uniref:hypothetical protein n=1 Tax=Aquimarina sp. ERC-38 TaxID=2949996 RepID=UPI002245E60B|nr:hypothetical protein [Aquimarina sp. ERC-38]UZO80358.1 hypothetical protein NBT05_15550 [Aquimarina sp. ERC-38]
MRLLCSIFLIVSFVSRPVMEISAVLYYQFNIDYIIANYCVNKKRPQLKCDGKCYLVQNIKKTATPTENNTSGAISIVESFLPLYFQQHIMDMPENIDTLYQEHQWGIKNLHSNLFTTTIDHPPNLFS